MNVSDIPVTSVSFRAHNRVILRSTKNPNMKVSDIPVTRVHIRQQQSVHLEHTNNLYMKVSDIPVASVNIRQHICVISKDTNKPKHSRIGANGQLNWPEWPAKLARMAS